MSIAPKKLAILVGGGPAPGINSVIGASTIRAAVEGVDVIGIRDGFKWIMQGDITHYKELNIQNVSRIHFRGGSLTAPKPGHARKKFPGFPPRFPQSRFTSLRCQSPVHQTLIEI